MGQAGVAAVVEPCGWPGRPRTNPGSFEDQFSALTGFEQYRAGLSGIVHFAALALNPREANDLELAPPVLNLLQHFLAKEVVVAVGETGYDAITEAEDAAFEWQIDLARRFELPLLVRVPALERSRAVRRALSVIRRSGFPEERVLVGPNDEETLPVVLSTGCWASHVLSPRGRLDAGRFAALVRRFGTGCVLVGSGADWDLGDPLAVPALAEVLAQAGLGEPIVETLLWKNPLWFFGQSGRLPSDLPVPPPSAVEPVALAER
jgi:predicted metal-dependent TIM-barrel fold hydrolase